METGTLQIMWIANELNSSVASDKKIDKTIDAQGLRCPMPLLKAKLALNQLEPGQRLLLTATDPASERDLGNYCKQVGYPVTLVSKDNNIFQYLITKTEPQ